MYQCEICKKKWNTPRERAQCEIKCDEVEQKKAEHIRVEKLRAEEECRLAEINKLFADLADAVKKYKQDYKKSIRFEMDRNDPMYSILPFFDLLRI